MNSIFTEHARTRMQQRGIPSAAVDLLINYGKSAPAGDGCELVFFDKAARARLFRDNPAAAREAERLCRTYAVLGNDGSVVTVGHRYRRIPRC
jgi:RimJ/RimL family protein N-acetyltransferase